MKDLGHGWGRVDVQARGHDYVTYWECSKCGRTASSVSGAGGTWADDRKDAGPCDVELARSVLDE